jgi:4-hydroxy-tetrahydrodipicolinate reductase
MNKIAINGAAGRMGQRLIDLAYHDPALQLVAAVDSPQHPSQGQDAGTIAGAGEINLAISDSYPACDVVIDFSTVEGAVKAIQHCHQNSVPLVMATTGLEATEEQMLREAANVIPIVWAPSMSMAVNLTMKLTQIAGQALKDHATGVDVEIIERHHRFKADSPSGTALKFGEIAATAMDISGHRHGREGMVGQRPHNEIGYHAVRTGDDPGQHTIVFGMLGETIELKVAASNRDCYASGALAAAKFVVQQSPGIYDMYDVLNLK